MKIYNLSIPVLLLFFVATVQPSNFSSQEASSQNEIHAMEVENENLIKKKGVLTAEQDFTACNTCASCDDECTQSEAACIGAIITVESLYCPFYSPIGSLSFPGNSQYICSITQIGIYQWYVEFNAVAYSCALPDTPFMFDIPVLFSYVCPTTSNNSLSTNLTLIIC